MSDAAASSQPDVVRVEFTYTPEDFGAYRKQAQRRYDANAKDDATGDDPFVVMYVLAFIAVAAGFVAFGVGAVRNIRNPTVPLLCGLTFYAVRWFERWLVARRVSANGTRPSPRYARSPTPSRSTLKAL